MYEVSESDRAIGLQRLDDIVVHFEVPAAVALI